MPMWGQDMGPGQAPEGETVIIYMWEFPASFGYQFFDGDGDWNPCRQPWLYRACEYHPWFEHTDRLLRPLH